MKDTAKIAGWLLSPGAMLVIEGAKQANALVNLASEKSLSELQAEVAKQEVRLKFELQQAKIAQELAIAQRISEAETVEIEEFYDVSGKIKTGVSVDEKSINAGLSGEGGRVSKRVYTFKGRAEVNAE